MSKMIAVTMGDPAGIGPEIIIKSLAEGALSGAPVVVVGCAQTLRRILALNITPRAELRIINHPAEASFSRLPQALLIGWRTTVFILAGSLLRRSERQISWCRRSSEKTI